MTKMYTDFALYANLLQPLWQKILNGVHELVSTQNHTKREFSVCILGVSQNSSEPVLHVLINTLLHWYQKHIIESMLLLADLGSKICRP